MQIQMQLFLWIIKGLQTPIYQRLQTIAITKMVRFSYLSFQTFKKAWPTCHLEAKVESTTNQQEWIWPTADKHNCQIQRILLKQGITHQLIIKQTSITVYRSILVTCNWIKQISFMTPWLRRWIPDKAITWIRERRTTQSIVKTLLIMCRLVQIANEMLKGKTFCLLIITRFRTSP